MDEDSCWQKLAILRVQVDAAPDDPALRCDFARAWAHLKVWKQVIRELRHAQALADVGSEVWKEATYMLGRLYEHAGKLNEAQAEYEALVEHSQDAE